VTDFDLTWQQVLINNGIDKDKAKSLIGFVSWNRGEPMRDLGEEMTQILSNHRGKVIVKDVSSVNYNDVGLLLLSQDATATDANEIFNIIMDYEQNEVYHPRNN